MDPSIRNALAWIPQPVEPLEQWMAGSPLVHVTFTKEALI